MSSRKGVPPSPFPIPEYPGNSSEDIAIEISNSLPIDQIDNSILETITSILDKEKFSDAAQKDYIEKVVIANLNRIYQILSKMDRYYKNNDESWVPLAWLYRIVILDGRSISVEINATNMKFYEENVVVIGPLFSYGRLKAKFLVELEKILGEFLTEISN